MNLVGRARFVRENKGLLTIQKSSVPYTCQNCEPDVCHGILEPGGNEPGKGEPVLGNGGTKGAEAGRARKS